MLMDVVETVQLWALKAAGAKSRRVDGGLGHVHILDVPGSGKGPPLVVIHGLGDAGVHFWLMILQLRKDFSRILVPDLLGHGYSDDHAELSGELIFGALVDALDRELGNDKAVVFGNSLGGSLAMGFAQMRPERVERLILVSPAGASWDETEFAEVMGAFDIQEKAKAIAFVHRLHKKPTWYARFIAPSIARVYARPGMVHLLRSFRRKSAHTPEMLQLVRAPTLLLWGGRDRILPKSSVAYFRAHLNATVEEPEGWGHCPQLDSVGSLSERVRRWAKDNA